MAFGWLIKASRGATESHAVYDLDEVHTAEAYKTNAPGAVPNNCGSGVEAAPCDVRPDAFVQDVAEQADDRAAKRQSACD